MGILGGAVGYKLLNRISQNGAVCKDDCAYGNQSKLSALLGESFLQEIKDRVVLDFGCGSGAEAVELAQRGAKKVIGVDIQEKWLEAARERAAQAGVKDLCTFTTKCLE